MMSLGDHWIRKFRPKVAMIIQTPASSHDVLNNQVKTCEGSTVRASDLLCKMQGARSIKSDIRNT